MDEPELEKVEQQKGKPDEDKDPEVLAQEGEAAKAKGEKVVTLAALHEEREKRKSLGKQLADAKKVETELADLKGKLEDIRPQLKILSDHPDLVEELAGRKSKPGETQPDDEDAQAIAEELGLYTADGQSDVKRGQRVIKAIDRRAEAIANKRLKEEVDPLRTTTLADRAALLREKAHNLRDDNNRVFAKREHIDSILDKLPKSLQADDKVVNAVMWMARGMGGGGGEAGEPMLTEHPGGRTKAAPISQLEEKAAEARGITAEKWRSLTDDKKGDVLE